jgi:aspartate kinase
LRLPLLVQKFGGTSVATAERIRAAARRAIRARRAGNQVVVVVSARGDTTDDLLTLAGEISSRPPARELDMLLATGEQISIALMSMAIQDLGAPAISLTGAQVGIVTDSTHGKARIRNISTQRIRHALAEGTIVVVAGFQGIDDELNITTLGRGGSDTTAVALAAVLKHDRAGTPPVSFPVGCEIYTDVDGVYTTDPRLIPDARKLHVISFDEMLEMASAGANVMHSRSIEFAKKFDVPVMVRSAFSDVEGTWIIPESPWMREFDICGVAIVPDEARISLSGLPNEPAAGRQVFSALAARNIVVDMIAQTVGNDGLATIGFTVSKSDLEPTLTALKPLAGDISHDDAVSKVSVVGAGMRARPGVAAKVLSILAAEQIEILMITTADIKISILVKREDGLRAMHAIHAGFRLHEPRGAGSTTDSANTPVWTTTADEAARSRELTARIAAMEDVIVSDIELKTDQGRIAIAGLPDHSVNCARFFEALARDGVVVSAIILNRTARGLAELTFSVGSADLERADGISRKVGGEIDSTVRVLADDDAAILFLWGVGMRSHAGVARTVFGTLADQGINVRNSNTSEVCITVVVERRHGKSAQNALRTAFQVT